MRLIGVEYLIVMNIIIITYRVLLYSESGSSKFLRNACTYASTRYIWKSYNRNKATVSVISQT
jgi:hypothetical protein